VACRRPREVLMDEPLALPDGRPDEADLLENRLLFGAILGTLSRPDQELARLRYFEDLTCATLADHLGLSEATVKVRLHRLRGRLRQRLEEQT
jgi:RNA polymerase sigma-70 factor (ECF subfamily)